MPNDVVEPPINIQALQPTLFLFGRACIRPLHSTTQDPNSGLCTSSKNIFCHLAAMRFHNLPTVHIVGSCVCESSQTTMAKTQSRFDWKNYDAATQLKHTLICSSHGSVINCPSNKPQPTTNSPGQNDPSPPTKMTPLPQAS